MRSTMNAISFFFLESFAYNLILSKCNPGLENSWLSERPKLFIVIMMMPRSRLTSFVLNFPGFAKMASMRSCTVARAANNKFSL